MKVRDMFEEEKIAKNFIANKLEDTEYFKKSQLFINQSWNKDFDSLTKKQQNWVTRLLDDCIEKRIEG